MPHYQPATIAVLGAETVVGHALCALLEGSGYDTNPLDAYPTGVVDELLDGSDLLLVVPRLDAGVRAAFLGAIGRSVPERAGVPVISLSTTTAEESLPQGKILSVPWPCTTEDLVRRIEAALAEQPPDHPHEEATNVSDHELEQHLTRRLDPTGKRELN